VNYLDELNEDQRAAVEHIQGPMMVIAGAGSGKTRVLTYRVAHLVKNGVDPFNILALTFTNKASREMKSRIGTIVGEQEARNIWMGTFHSVFARILRIEADHINYPRNFTIYDTQDSRNLLKDIVKELGLDPKVYKPSVVLGRISNAKNNLISPEAYIENTDIVNEDHQSGKAKMGQIYLNYTIRCFRAGAMDFDDLLYKTNVLLRKFPEVLHKYQHRFKYILVDEYQDTNFSQYLIVKQLSAAHQNLCVVGDDAQSIYGFRGANIQNILNFRKDYPDFALFKLEQNYRSTKTLVKAANTIIAKNKDQIQKTVWTENDDGHPINVHRAFSDNDEGKHVADVIFEIGHTEKATPSDFAILYRTNAQSSNPNDEESLKRIINYPTRGIGNTSVEKLVIKARESEKSVWDVITDPSLFPTDISTRITGKIGDFATMIKSFTIDLDSKNAYDMGMQIASSSGILKEHYDDKSPERISRYENIQELLNGMKEFSIQKDPNEPDKINTLPDFLVDVALLTDLDTDNSDEETISLMTIHAAKGLEFPYVFVVGMEENLFPSQLSLNTRADLEEERRLFYVAITRAKRKAYLSYALSRFKWGNLVQCEPSRFIEDIDPSYVELPTSMGTPQPTGLDFTSDRSNFFGKSSTKRRPHPMKRSRPPKTVEATIDPDFSPSDMDEIQSGMEVLHQRFGKGKVLTIEGDHGVFSKGWPKAVTPAIR
jgi:DNA helicase-2/ATP-dependent DNA helicase PcrA